MIHLGFKIDFEEEHDSTDYLPKLRNITHLHESWLIDNSKFFIWQEFIKYLHLHLEHVSILEPFYFEILEKISKKFYTQNPKRVILESFVELLEFEGLSSFPFVCTKCHEIIEDRVVFAKRLKPFHIGCIELKKSFGVDLLEKLFRFRNGFELDDEMVEELYKIVL